MKTLKFISLIVLPIFCASGWSLANVNEARPVLVLDPETEEWVVEAINRPEYKHSLSEDQALKARELDMQIRRKTKGSGIGTVTGIQQTVDGEVFVYQGAFKNISVIGDDIYLSTFTGLGMGYDSRTVYKYGPFHDGDYANTEARGIIGFSLGLKALKCHSVEFRNDYQKGFAMIEPRSRARLDTNKLNSTVRFQIVKYSNCKVKEKDSGLKEETDRLLNLQREIEESLLAEQ